MQQKRICTTSKQISLHAECLNQLKAFTLPSILNQGQEAVMSTNFPDKDGSPDVIKLPTVSYYVIHLNRWTNCATIAIHLVYLEHNISKKFNLYQYPNSYIRSYGNLDSDFQFHPSIRILILILDPMGTLIQMSNQKSSQFG